MVSRMTMNRPQNDSIPGATSREDLLGMLYVVFADVNLDLPLDQQLASSESTPLGLGGAVDSLTLITILVSMQKQIARRYGVSMELLADAELLGDHSLLQNAGTLATFLAKRIASRKI